jgi:hypothetical protein
MACVASAECSLTVWRLVALSRRLHYTSGSLSLELPLFASSEYAPKKKPAPGKRAKSKWVLLLVMLGRLIVTHLVLGCIQIFVDQTAEVAQTQREKCVLEGTAVDFITAEPLRKAVIHLVPLSAPTSPAYMGITDPSGQFHFKGVPERGV